MKIPDTNIELTGIKRLVINKKAYYEKVWYPEPLWEDPGSDKHLVGQREMVWRIKHFMANPRARLWVSGDTINVVVE